MEGYYVPFERKSDPDYKEYSLSNNYSSTLSNSSVDSAYIVDVSRVKPEMKQRSNNEPRKNVKQRISEYDEDDYALAYSSMNFAFSSMNHQMFDTNKKNENETKNQEKSCFSWLCSKKCAFSCLFLLLVLTILNLVGFFILFPKSDIDSLHNSTVTDVITMKTTIESAQSHSDESTTRTTTRRHILIILGSPVYPSNTVSAESTTTDDSYVTEDESESGTESVHTTTKVDSDDPNDNDESNETDESCKSAESDELEVRADDTPEFTTKLRETTFSRRSNTKVTMNCCKYLDVTATRVIKEKAPYSLGRYELVDNNRRVYTNHETGYHLFWAIGKSDNPKWQISTNIFMKTSTPVVYSTARNCTSYLCPTSKKISWMVWDKEHGFIQDKTFKVTCMNGQMYMDEP